MPALRRTTKTWVIAGILLLLAATFFAVRLLSAEDDWICQDGAWVRHGNPNASMPQTGCGSNEPQDAAYTPRPGEFQNGQRYATFATDDFSVNYPDWPRFDTSAAPDADAYKLAVANAGCSFIIKVASVPEDVSFKDYIQSVVRETSSQYPITMLSQDIGDASAHFEGEVTMGDAVVKNVTYSYLTGTRQSVGIGFVSARDQFDEACQPIVGEVVESVVVN